MGNFRITIDAVGDHGADREVKDGESLPENVSEGIGRCDQVARNAVHDLKAKGCTITGATITHWPGSASEVTDDLVNLKRKGSF